MKLPDFIENKVFDRIRKNMDIPKQYIPKYDFSIKYERLKLEMAQFEELENGRGLEIDLNELDKGIDNTLLHGNKNVILYIRDQYHNLSSTYKKRPYKYHISWCAKLKEMRDNDKLDRYIISRRTDGKFQVNILDSSNHNLVSEGVLEELQVCKYCLSQVNYKGYKNQGKEVKESIYENFSLEEFLSEYDTKFKQYPKYTETTAPPNKYHESWREISIEYRSKQNWTCEKCGRNLKDNKSYLDVHHIDSNKNNNNYSNLKALCRDCHGDEYNHEHYRAKHRGKSE